MTETFIPNRPGRVVAPLRPGARVVVLVGERAGVGGTVADVYREAGCGCLSVIVRLETGREWAGKASEVRLA